MNYVFTNPQCSSGCESGWTLYFEQSSIYPYQEKNDFLGEGRSRVCDSRVREEEEDHEDLSMVSDASSGPPHFFSEDQEEGCNGGIDTNGCFYYFSNDSLLSRNGVSKQKIRENECKKVKADQYSALLDDTASSTLLDFSTTNTIQPSMENVLEYSSQGYSTTYSEPEVRGSYDNKDHYDFFKSSPLSGKHIQQNQWFEGKRC